MRNRKAIIRNGRIVYDEEATVARPTETNARFEREAERKTYAREITQPSSTNFYKAYPERAKEIYSEETLRLIS
jgi:hypothetical protein